MDYGAANSTRRKDWYDKVFVPLRQLVQRLDAAGLGSDPGGVGTRNNWKGLPSGMRGLQDMGGPASSNSYAVYLKLVKNWKAAANAVGEPYSLTKWNTYNKAKAYLKKLQDEEWELRPQQAPQLQQAPPATIPEEEPEARRAGINFDFATFKEMLEAKNTAGEEERSAELPSTSDEWVDDGTADVPADPDAEGTDMTGWESSELYITPWYKKTGVYIGAAAALLTTVVGIFVIKQMKDEE